MYRAVQFNGLALPGALHGDTSFARRRLAFDLNTVFQGLARVNDAGRVTPGRAGFCDEFLAVDDVPQTAAN